MPNRESRQISLDVNIMGSTLFAIYFLYYLNMNRPKRSISLFPLKLNQYFLCIFSKYPVFIMAMPFNMILVMYFIPCILSHDFFSFS